MGVSTVHLMHLSTGRDATSSQIMRYLVHCDSFIERSCVDCRTQFHNKCRKLHYFELHSVHIFDSLNWVFGYHSERKTKKKYTQINVFSEYFLFNFQSVFKSFISQFSELFVELLPVLLCVSRCRTIAVREMNLIGHPSCVHAKGLSPVWVRLWIFSAPLWVNVCEQMLHLKYNATTVIRESLWMFFIEFSLSTCELLLTCVVDSPSGSANAASDHSVDWMFSRTYHKCNSVRLCVWFRVASNRFDPGMTCHRTANSRIMLLKSRKKKQLNFLFHSRTRTSQTNFLSFIWIFICADSTDLPVNDFKQT